MDVTVRSHFKNKKIKYHPLGNADTCSMIIQASLRKRETSLPYV